MACEELLTNKRYQAKLIFITLLHSANLQWCQTLGSGARVGPAKTPIRSIKRLENVIGFDFWTFNCIFTSFKPFLLIESSYIAIHAEPKRN